MQKTVTISKGSLLRIVAVVVIIAGLVIIAGDIIGSGRQTEAETETMTEVEQAAVLASGSRPVDIALALAKAEADDAALWRQVEAYDALLTSRAQAEMRIKADQVCSYLDRAGIALRLEWVGEPTIEELSAYTTTVYLPVTVVISSSQGTQARDGVTIVTLVKQRDGRWLADSYQSAGER